MSYIKRAALVVSLLSVGLLSFFATSVVVDAHAKTGAAIVKGGGGGGGGGGGFLPAGNYTNTNVNASMCCGGLTVTVNASTSSSRPLGGPATSTNEVDVSFNICDFANGVCGSGCFVAAASDFTVAGDLGSATLNTTFTGAQPPCPQPFGGPPVNFQPPLPAQPTFTLQASWTNVGPVGSARNIGRYMCSGYSTETATSGSSANGVTATSQISLEPPTTTFGPIGGFLSTFNQTIRAQGAPADTCNPLGGKGAGPGPLNPGNFQFNVQQAFVALPPSTTLPVPLNVSITTFTNISSPRGGGTTTQSETDLSLSEPLFPPTIQGCFVLPAGAFIISSAGASLHVAIDLDGATQQCQFAPPAAGLPDEFNVDITWSVGGALATFRTDSSFACGQVLSTVGSSVQTNVNAGASGLMTGVTDPFSAVPGSVFTNANNIHVVRPATC